MSKKKDRAQDPSETEFVVVCRGDAAADSVYVFGTYELATRTVFPTRESAMEYAASVAEGRQPLVVAGRWGGLRRDAAERFPRRTPAVRGRG